MFIATLPHSGEKIPDLCGWLKGLPEEVLLRDVDRFVDQLYEPTLIDLQIPYVKTEWNRYVADLNREPGDVDQDSVEGAELAPGKMPRGFHWVITTKGETLLKRPLSREDHQALIDMIYTPFHTQIQNLIQSNKLQLQPVWHLDLHSMPSLGTKEHRDPGELRADIVVSDCLGKSADKKFVDLVICAYVRAGFKVRYNWPYFGGKITEVYGQPERFHHTVQIELNRSLYMNEETKQKVKKFSEVQFKLDQALKMIQGEVKKW